MADQVDPLGTLQHLLEVCRGTGELAAAVARLGLARGIKAFLESRGEAGLAKDLGLSVAPGKKNETVSARLAAAKRAELLQLAQAATGKTNAHALAAALMPLASGSAQPPSGKAQRLMEELKELGASLPSSKSGLYAVIIGAEIFKK